MPYSVYLTRHRTHAGEVVLKPADALSEERLTAIRAKPGDILRADIVRPRSGPHHRWFMALLKTVSDAMGGEWTPENLRLWLKLKAGFVEVYEIDGKTIIKPRSMSFASMKQDEFSEVSQRMIDLICAELIPGMAASDLRREVESFLAPELERA